MEILKIIGYIGTIAAVILFIAAAISRLGSNNSIPFRDSCAKMTTRGLAFFFGRATKIYILIFSVSLISLLASSETVHETIGYHNLRIKGSGIYCYYVEVSDSDRTYTLPAKVIVEQYSDTDGERSYSWKNYTIASVYFDNGNSLEFTEFVVEIGEPQTASDQYGNEWRCKLINEHAVCAEVEETSNTNQLYKIQLALSIFIVLYMIYALLRYDEE